MQGGMFSNLTDWDYQRSGKQAFGFYLVMLAGIFLIGGLIGGLAEVLTYDALTPLTSLSEGRHRMSNGPAGKIIRVASFLFCELLAILIVRRKKLYTVTWFGNVLLAGILSLILGGMFGLIPVAFLTTRPKAVS